MAGKKWTEWEIEALRRLFPDSESEEVARKIGRSKLSVSMKAFELGIKKSEERISETNKERLERLSKTSRKFKKGNAPWNKGLKIPGYGDPSTYFCKGQKPWSWLPVGSVRVGKDGHLVIKIADTSDRAENWTPVHYMVWRRHYGEVPDGKMVLFREGMKTTVFDEITIDRLEVASRGDLLQRYSPHKNMPPELYRVYALNNVLAREINKHLKGQRK
jgi:hypothetical protein